MQVHFDCMYKSLDVVSSRSARLLGANRSIAEVTDSPADHIHCHQSHMVPEDALILECSLAAPLVCKILQLLLLDHIDN